VKENCLNTAQLVANEQNLGKKPKLLNLTFTTLVAKKKAIEISENDLKYLIVFLLLQNLTRFGRCYCKSGKRILITSVKYFPEQRAL
jgi:hypothetical protein